MSFGDWVNNGWLVVRKSSKQEFGNLLGIVARDLKDSQRRTCRTIGASPSLTTPDNHHHRVIQSLELNLGKDAKFVRAFDSFRRKRNVSNYDIGGGISHREVEEMTGIWKALQQEVEQWIHTNHALLL